jgi:methionyl-tRNA formyltransferase
MNKNLRIVFMGTPDFAVASLDILLKNNYNVVGVITALDKASGRGQKINQSSVKQYAVANGLNVLQPVKLKSPEFIEELKALKADLQIVVAFRMLPEIVWNMPRLGTFNVHGSLLPQYRGAAPIHWAVINGEKETGVTTFFLKHEIDTGSIILQDKIKIGENDTTGQVYNTLMNRGAKLLLKSVRQIEEGTYKEIPQSDLIPAETELKHAPKIFKDDCKIDWIKSAQEVHSFVRGLNPFPSAFTNLFDGDKNTTCKIHSTYIYSNQELAKPKVIANQIETDNKTYVKVNCGLGAVLINELQLAGKKRMLIKDFLAGYKLTDNSHFI